MQADRRSRRSPGLTGYVAGVLLVGAACLGSEWSRAGAGPLLPFERTAFWLFLTLAAELFWLETPTGRGMVSMSLAVNIAALYALPPHLALGIGAAGVLVADLLVHRRGLLKATFNSGQTAIALFACVWTIRLIGGTTPVEAGALFLREPLVTLAPPIVFFAANTLLVSGAISLDAGIALRRAWTDNYGFFYQYLSSATLSLLGLILVLAIQAIGYVSGILYLLLFFFVRDSYQRYIENRRAAFAAHSD